MADVKRKRAPLGDLADRARRRAKGGSIEFQVVAEREFTAAHAEADRAESFGAKVASCRPIVAVPRMAFVKPGYEQLADVLELALTQAQSGKGHERHAGKDEPFHEQQIVQLGEWMGQSSVFAIGQACKKSMESTRLEDGEREEAELLGAINYLAAAIIVNRRRRGRK